MKYQISVSILFHQYSFQHYQFYLKVFEEHTRQIQPQDTILVAVSLVMALLPFLCLVC